MKEKEKKDVTEVFKGTSDATKKAAPAPLRVENNSTEEVKRKTFEETVQAVKDGNIVLPANHFMFLAPIVEKQTKSGIWKPDQVINEEEKQGSWLQWHKVVAVGVTAHPLAVGDNVWVSVSKGLGATRVPVGDEIYWIVECFAIVCIRRDGNNVPTTKDLTSTPVDTRS